MAKAKSEMVRLYIVEEQEIYREVYRYAFPSRSNLELLRVSASGEAGMLSQSVTELRPDVLLLSVKKLNADIIGELERMRNGYPQLGIVILLSVYNSKDIELLRRLALSGEGGMALFLK